MSKDKAIQAEQAAMATVIDGQDELQFMVVAEAVALALQDNQEHIL